MSKLAALIAVAGLGALAVATIGVTAEKKAAYMPEVATKKLFQGPFNKSASEPTEIVVFQVHGEGEPLMHKAD